MARSGIQYSDVQQAVDTLLARGDTPSVQRIREVLGTGSFTTISEHFRSWRIEREQNRDVPPPKGVPEVIVNVASELWREAQEVANQALIHYREDANRQVENAQQEAAEALQQAANAEQRESALAEHLRHTEQRLETLNRELAASQANEHQWQHQAEQAAKDAKQYQQLLTKSEYEVATLKERFAEEQQQRQAVWEQRLTQEEQRNEAAEGKLMALLDTLRQERAQEEKALQKRLQQTEQRADTLTKELQLKKETLQHYQLDNSSLQQRINELERMNASLEEQHNSLKNDLNKAYQALEKQHQTALKDDNWQQQLWQRMEALQEQLTALPKTLSFQEKENRTNDE
ncbi:DNA-binding protein [Halomonas alkaliantarctica]|uniref:DNA-binding protein n=1 Tax=Halomonas alkaliantarctica TaxID=232346 RepID=UPI0004AA80B6|nr:DNA-binding protein [Halomonas alkaliantarctica]